ncbi:putative ribonuclease H-like domain-containing protein [Tanacetum coccineum]
MAFISSSNTNSGKSEVSTVQGVSTSGVQVSTASTDVAATSLSHDTIDDDDIEEMDIKWNLALLSMRADRFWKKTGKKISIQGSHVAGFDKSKVECFNCHKMGHFARECRAPRSQDKGRRESYKKDPKVEEPTPKAMIAIDGIGWDWSYMADEDENHALVANEEEVPTEYALMAKSSSSSDNEVYDDSYCSKSCRKNTENLNNKIIKLNEELSDCETDLYNYKRGLSQVEARLVEFKNNEIKFCERIRVLERDIELKDNKIENLRNELEELKKEKDSIDFKIKKFENSAKDLDCLLGTQRSVKDKTGLGLNEYTAVPPPPAQVYSPPKNDLSWTGLPEFVDDTVTDYSRPTPSIDVPRDVSESVSFFEQRGSVGNVLSKPMISFVKETGCPSVSKVNNTEKSRKPTVKYAEMYRSQRPRGNQRNWNNQKSQQLGSDFVMIKKACYVCGSFEHLQYTCKHKRHVNDQKQVKPVWNNSKRFDCKQNTRVNKGKIWSRVDNNNNNMKYPYTLNSAYPKLTSFKPAHSHVKRPFVRKTAVKNKVWVPTARTKVPTAKPTVAAVKGNRGKAVKASACWIWRPKQNQLDQGSNLNGVSGIPQDNIDDKGYWDSGCSRHMTGNISYLSEYEPYDGGYVSFGHGGGKITGKGTIKTGKLEFENVYFVKELKYNLFSVSQICDNKNSVLFTDSECLVLGKDFKLDDDTHVLLRTPRQQNMYSIDLKNIVPHKNLTCLIAKASADESMLWHRRLGHLNFKTMNKLVRNNLVKGLPSKSFANIHTCVACLKGKQHKASCKTKLVSSITKPLHTLHMDLFGPTSVSSLNHKWYCLVVTDDFSRFTWTFFLKSKDETSSILRNFITEIENLKDLKVKIIRCDNGGEFRNKEMDEFCTRKGIKREFSNARTPQQNGVAERRNRTLIEAARTMLADAKLPVTFWAEAVNTACYVQNRVLVNELFNGRSPAIGYFVGYSLSSKAFRVFNKRTKKIEENLHVDFLENQPIEKGFGPNCLFDIDSLTKSMNYVPVVVTGTSSTNISCTKEVANQTMVGNVSTLRFIALPNWFHEAQMATFIDSSKKNDVSQKEQDRIISNSDAPESSGNSNPTAIAKDPTADQVEPVLTSTVETKVPTETPSLGNAMSFENRLEDLFGDITALVSLNEVEADLSNMETNIQVSPSPTLRIHKVYPKNRIIGHVDAPVQTRQKTKNMEEQSFIATIHQKTNPKLLQYCLFSVSYLKKNPRKSLMLSKIQPPGFQDSQFPDRVYKVVKAMYGLHQAPRAWYGTLSKYLLDNGFQRGLQVLQKKDGIFLSQDKYVFDILKKFGLSDVRSMIGSLMYLTASRPDMFAVCACARHQVTPKECHLHTVKGIFRYLKGHPKLGLWYPKESPFDLVAYSDSDYGGATQDRKSTTRGCQFLGRRLISWQCKKQTIVATSTTEAEYVAAASGCGQVLWIQNQLLDYGYNFMNTKIYIDNNSAICIVKNPVYHSRTKHIEIRHHFIRDCYEKKLINVDHIHSDDNVADLLTKAFDVGRFQYLVVSIGMLDP